MLADVALDGVSRDIPALLDLVARVGGILAVVVMVVRYVRVSQDWQSSSVAIAIARLAREFLRLAATRPSYYLVVTPNSFYRGPNMLVPVCSNKEK